MPGQVGICNHVSHAARGNWARISVAAKSSAYGQLGSVPIQNHCVGHNQLWRPQLRCKPQAEKHVGYVTFRAVLPVAGSYSSWPDAKLKRNYVKMPCLTRCDAGASVICSRLKRHIRRLLKTGSILLSCYLKLHR